MCSHARFSEVENIVSLRESLSEPPLSMLPGVGGFPKAFFQLWLYLYGVKCQGTEQKLLALEGISSSAWMSLCSALRLSRLAVLRVH